MRSNLCTPPRIDTEGEEQAPSAGLSRSAFVRRFALAAGFLTFGKLGTPFAGSLAPLTAFAAAPKPKQLGMLLGNVKRLAPNRSLAYTDPRSGDPAVLIRLPDGQFVSYDAVCTHAGCTVPYDPARKLLVCPCHGATYDPARGAAVVGGPAPQPLARLPIRVDSSGNVYALDVRGSGVAKGGLRQPPPPSKGDDSGGDDGGTGNRNRRPRRGKGGDT